MVVIWFHSGLFSNYTNIQISTEVSYCEECKYHSQSSS